MSSGPHGPIVLAVLLLSVQICSLDDWKSWLRDFILLCINYESPSLDNRTKVKLQEGYIDCYLGDKQGADNIDTFGFDNFTSPQTQKA